jgi:hypothetical protein
MVIEPVSLRRLGAPCLLLILRFRAQTAPDQPAAEKCGCDPDGDNDRSSSSANRPVVGCRSQFTVLCHDMCRDQANDEPNPDRYQDHIIQITEHGHEIGDQIDGGKRIGRNKYRQRLCMPWDSRIATAEIDRVNVPLDETSPILHSAGLAEPQSAALSELRDKPARTIRVTATVAKILLNDPGVKMRVRMDDRLTSRRMAIPPAANNRCRRLCVN